MEAALSGNGSTSAEQREVVVIGASAGGVEALCELVEGLPQELPAAVFVVLHVMPSGHSVLPKILARRTRMTVSAAEDGEPIERGHIYVAPPDRHMLIDQGCMLLTRGPRENGHRPAIDPLFRSAARAYGRRAIGVVLSGALDDGTAGLKAISVSGGGALVQEPSDALYPSMPRSAIENDQPDWIGPVAEMSKAICTMIDEPLDLEDEPMDDAPNDRDQVDQPDRSDDDPRDGEITDLTCPECGGTLWQHGEGGFVRFKCHVGHAYSPGSLEVGQYEALESALWAALRNLQERGHLYRRLARRTSSPARYEGKAEDADRHAEILREFVMSVGRDGTEAGETGTAAT